MSAAARLLTAALHHHVIELLVPAGRHAGDAAAGLIHGSCSRGGDRPGRRSHAVALLVQPSSYADLDKEVAVVKRCITPRLQNMCQWECCFLMSYRDINHALPNRFQ